MRPNSIRERLTEIAVDWVGCVDDELVTELERVFALGRGTRMSKKAFDQLKQETLPQAVYRLGVEQAWQDAMEQIGTIDQRSGWVLGI